MDVRAQGRHGGVHPRPVRSRANHQLGNMSQTIFSSAFNESVLAWDTATGELRGQFGNEWSRALALSPDGELLATGADGLMLWGTELRRKVRHCIGPKKIDAIFSAAWSANGKTLISSSQDGTIRVWDPATGKQRLAIET